MSDVPAKRRGHEFSPEEIERSLLALALCGGNSERAHAMLKHDTTLERAPSPSCLREWRLGPHAQRYHELRTDQAPAIEASAIGDYREIVVEGARAQLNATRQAAKNISHLFPDDAAKVAKDLAIATGVAADKLLVFTDRPNVIHAHPDPMNTLTSLMGALGIPASDIIPGTATEIPTMALTTESDDTNPCEGSSAAGDSPSA